ncbi:MAG: hypothetical protein SNJ74_02240 [Fimbriimonadaceae bacterium]
MRYHQDMAVSVARENYFWHKVHSLTGIVPVGYYLVQHLTLNSFSLAGADKFNGVIAFFHAMPLHFLLAITILFVWAPVLFHAVYGLFIVSRAMPNLSQSAYKYRENRYYTFQRASGIIIFLFLCYHVTATSIASKVTGDKTIIQYEGWADKLSAPVFGIPYFLLAVYVIGVTASSYHLAYGLWSFCIRWGITISEQAQNALWKVAKGAFVVITLLGYAALAGFFYSPFEKNEFASEPPVQVRAEAPIVVSR